MVLQERFSFTSVFPSSVKTHHLQIVWDHEGCRTECSIRLLQPRFELLSLSLSPTPLFVHPALHTAPPPHKRSLNQQNLGFSSPFARPRSLTQLQREEVKQTCGKAKRADPSQNGIMMPIFWEGHQGFGQNRGRSGIQKRFGLVPGFWHLPHRCTKLGLGGVRTSLALRFALHKLFFVAGLNSRLSRPAVRLVNGVRNTSLVSLRLASLTRNWCESRGLGCQSRRNLPQQNF